MAKIKHIALATENPAEVAEFYKNALIWKKSDAAITAPFTE